MKTDYPTGSSPLARGLPSAAGRSVQPVGIIPSRAGFTSRRPCRSSPISDHPRSRGVYLMATNADNVLGGSSPLARGLRTYSGSSPVVAGIIPARAGFTAGTARRARTGRDHPRSRGVYRRARKGKKPINGSSPLARGLRRPHLAVLVEPRIIPARAGFTRLDGAHLGTYWDHPRSRGVYTGDARTRMRIVGSSPLARGLPRWRGPARRPAGIIPARAGFTP